MESNYVGKVCRFKQRGQNAESDRMVFVQSKCGSQTTPPQIIDKRAKGKDDYYHYYLLNETAAFITSLVFQHVPVNLVIQAYMSRFGVDQPTAESDVTGFLDTLAKELDCVYMKPLEVRPYQPPELGDRSPFQDNLYLHFDVEKNQTGGTYIKIPPT
ncbi:MAG: PqqD family protein [Desulfobacteraceae bacterium]